MRDTPGMPAVRPYRRSVAAVSGEIALDYLNLGGGVDFHIAGVDRMDDPVVDEVPHRRMGLYLP